MFEQPRRKLVISLPDNVYCALEAQAAANDRVAAQQATHLLRSVLKNDAEDGLEPHDDDGAPAVGGHR